MPSVVGRTLLAKKKAIVIACPWNDDIAEKFNSYKKIGKHFVGWKKIK